MKSTNNLERLKRELKDTLLDYNKSLEDYKIAEKRYLQACESLADAEGTSRPFSKGERKTFDLIRKTHKEQHKKIRRWWCAYCNNQKLKLKDE